MMTRYISFFSCVNSLTLCGRSALDARNVDAAAMPAELTAPCRSEPSRAEFMGGEIMPNIGQCATTQLGRRIFPLLLLMLLSMMAVAKPQTSWAQSGNQVIPIVSGSGWVVTTSPGPDCPAAGCLLWTTINYDDSTWVSPVLKQYNGSVNTKDVIPGTKASFMWYPNSSELVAYFRYKFTINANPQSLIAGRAYVGADDYYELWVNGNFVISGLLGQHLYGNCCRN